MDTGRVLARSLEIAWRHKVLWILGFVMALTGGGGGNGLRYDFSSTDLGTRTQPFGAPFPSPGILPAVIVTVLAFAACFFLLYLIFTFYFRFVARGAMVAFVRGVEQGRTPTLGVAWREGQQYYGRLLGLGLLFNVPLSLFSIAAIAAAIIPFIGTIVYAINLSGSRPTTPPNLAPIWSGLAVFIGLLCSAVLCLVVVNLVLHPIYEFAVRGIVLEDTRVTNGLKRGYRHLRENLGPVALLYLLLIGARIGWTIVVGVFGLPFSFLLLGAITLAAATHQVTVIILVATIIGLPLALVLIFLEGLFEVFEANAWTEGYLALLAPAPSATPMPSAPIPAASS